MDSTALLGISGYTFADLHDPERLASLYDRFCEEVEHANPGLWREWDEYRRFPDEPRAPVELSNLLVAMAPHVSAFLARLFDVGRSKQAIEDSTHTQDSLFRFKVDFVRRRVLSLVKGGAHIAISLKLAEDDAAVERMIAEGPAKAGHPVPEGPAKAGHPEVRGVRLQPDQDRELALAEVGCALL